MAKEANRSEPLEPFAALIGEWATQAVHPALPDTVVHGRVRFEWLAGERFVIQHAENDHPLFPDSIGLIGTMEGDDDLSMQVFDSRGIHRTYGIGFDGTSLRMWRDDPGFAQRFIAILDPDGRSMQGHAELDQDGQGFRQDLAVSYRRTA